MRRRSILAAILAGLGLIAAPALLDHRPWLIWNASASVPIGLYRVDETGGIAIGDLVAVAPPDELAAFLAERGYLPYGVPILKHLAALAGSVVCRDGAIVSVDGRPMAVALLRDSRGRPLPAWAGCRILGNGEVFLLNPDTPESFDGRYFGPLPVDTIIARLTPLWTDASGALGWPSRPSSSPRHP